MSERLKELQRQRALAQEQLAWFDRELAKETGQTPAAPQPAAIPPAAEPNTGDTARAAEEILARYQQPGPTAEKNIKRGCYLYALFAFGLLVLMVVGAYYLYLSFKK